MTKTKNRLIAAGIAAVLATPVTPVFADSSNTQTFQDKGSIQLTYQVVDTPHDVTVPIQVNSASSGHNTGISSKTFQTNLGIVLAGCALMVLTAEKKKSEEEA